MLYSPRLCTLCTRWRPRPGNTWPYYSCTCIPTPVSVRPSTVPVYSEKLHRVVSRKRGSQSFVTNRKECTQCRKIVCISKSMNKEFKRIRAVRFECSAFSIRVFFKIRLLDFYNCLFDSCYCMRLQARRQEFPEGGSSTCTASRAPRSARCFCGRIPGCLVQILQSINVKTEF